MKRVSLRLPSIARLSCHFLKGKSRFRTSPSSLSSLFGGRLAELFVNNNFLIFIFNKIPLGLRRSQMLTGSHHDISWKSWEAKSELEARIILSARICRCTSFLVGLSNHTNEISCYLPVSGVFRWWLNSNVKKTGNYWFSDRDIKN